MPKLVHEGQKAMQQGSLLEARQLFSAYLMGQDEGRFAEGVKWAVASLPKVSDEP